MHLFFSIQGETLANGMVRSFSRNLKGKPIIGDIGVKFKFIVLFFNVVLIILFGMILFLPSVLLNPAGRFPWSIALWSGNAGLVLVLLAAFLALFTLVNIVYLRNRKLLTLLEREDWPALVHYLEDEVLNQGKFSPRLVRLLANGYLILADSAAVMGLEHKVSLINPALVESNALLFGAARILGKDISGAIRFFVVRKDAGSGSTGEWIRWYYAFSLLLDRRYREAGEEFSVIAQTSSEGIVAALASYFLETSIVRILKESVYEGESRQADEYRAASAKGKERVHSALPRLKDWQKETARTKGQIHAAILVKYLHRTATWLYSE